MTSPQIVASGIFVVTVAVILSERLHRTIAAMAGAVVMLGAGMLLGFYNQQEALASIDFNTLGLLLGMMILVRMLQQTGFFRYLAVAAAKRTQGNPLLLFIALGTLTTVLSMFLDNVTTVVLIAPVTILIAEILGINPIPMLMAEALLSDTGGVATLVGDPPNVIIGSAAGFSFVSFLTHLAPVVLVAWLVALGVLWFIFRRELGQRPSNVAALMQLDEKEGLRERVALHRILITLAGVIILFFFQERLHLAPGAIALGGAAAAMLWVRPDVEETLRRVEWGVLLFFGALFVATGGLEASGVLGLIADRIAGLANASLLGASLLMLWVAAALSAVVDNIPFTIAMVPVIERLGSLGVNAVPLWWALALGAGFGGNGTPIGSTANVVTVALSEKTRTPITTRLWLRSGLPVMLATCAVASLIFILLFGRMQTP
jgi:Na+/H+ antiporter NhaD/arsenite permease-like protein